MSNTSSDQNFIEFLNYVSIQIDRYFTVFIFLFGVIGNILNILVLSKRTLRSNPCAWLFLTSSIANLISILFCLITRILSGWSLDSTDTIGWICKCRAFILFTSRTIAFWLVAFASINRWFSSSRNVHYRQMNTLKNVKKSFIIVVFLSILLHSQMLYCYDANLIGTPLKCYGKTTLCRLFSDITYATISILLPLLLMIIFGLKTLYNVHQTQLRVHHQRIEMTSIIRPNNNNQRIISNFNERQNQWKQQDRHLFVMLLVQIIIQAFLTLSQACEKFYISITMFQLQTPLKLTIDHFVYNLTLLLSFLASGMPFYIYTLCGGSVFRKPLLNIVRHLSRKMIYWK
jgi:hypothetical protein